MAFGNDAQVLFALYIHSTVSSNVKLFSPSNTTEFDQFRKRAQIFSIQQVLCRGYWSATTIDVQSCTREKAKVLLIRIC
ncbi:hypothetical protein BU25DRAFT_411115 [Macroventuria anomochaeta]|uniref:Uncharacterized protein n=1 Tax=Macroventuria anomochaeta TaxID=301207 RepID=A0ACB6S021_9PLEO|nr:uncharacterized protein BU25DRAFT_411115 [Macroventuria anomochaeta]KAF2627010.1 hypothetical protein BU25DRAFT_411115 [Macroventuria anomochaeta]